MTLVIIAAGMGSRYGGMKQIDPITENGEFIIDFTVYDAIKAGFDKAVIVVKEENLDLFKSTIGARIEPHIGVEYVFQKNDALPNGFSCPKDRVKPWGTGQAVLSAKNAVKGNFAAVNSDDFYGRDAFVKLAEHLSKAKTVDGVEDCCMIGYVLGKTMTENGSVSRGECKIDESGLLESIVERKKIVRGDGTGLYEDGGEWKPISLDTTVSMNCFGFTEGAFEHFERGFEEFLADNSNDLTAEYYYPVAVFNMINNNKAKVRVYNTSENWYGVTYHDDKPRVISAIRELIDRGVYPKKLWE